MLPRGACPFEITVNLAVRKEKPRCWGNEVYAEDRAHPLLPLGRLANLLNTKFVWENGQAFMQFRDKGKWKTMTKFEVRNNMACASHMQLEVPRRASMGRTSSTAEPSVDWSFWEKAARDPKMTTYIFEPGCEGEDV